MLNNISFMFMWLCSTIMVVSFFSAVLYYNLQTPSFNEMVIELVEKYDINPMVLQCMDENWQVVANFEICRVAAQNPRMSDDEMNQILDGE